MGMGLLVLAVGFAIIFVGAFVNIVLQPRWYPGDMPQDRQALRGAVRSTRGGLMMLGIIQIVLFMIGGGLVTAAAAFIATTLGYGGG